MNKKQAVILSAVVLFVLTGCVTIPDTIHHETPIPQSADPENVFKFTSDQPVSLSNNQPSDDKKYVFYFNHHKYYASHKEWTEVALLSLEAALKKRGLRIDKNSPKTLKISVSDVAGEMAMGGWGIKCQLVIEVITGDGYRNTYVGSNQTVRDFLSAGSWAIAYGVEEMLADPEIKAYLNR